MKRALRSVVSLSVVAAAGAGAFLMAACEDDASVGAPLADASSDSTFDPDSATATGNDSGWDAGRDAAADLGDAEVTDAADASDGSSDILDIDAALQSPDGGGPALYVVNGATSLGSFLQGFALADFDEDGKLDIAIAGRDTANVDGVILALGDGKGGFAYEATVATEWAAADIVTSDFNKDGHEDLLVYQSGVGTSSYVALGKGNGLFAAPTKVAIPNDGNGERLAAADFNKDGFLDVAVPLGSVPWVVLNDTKGGFAPPTSLGGNGGTFYITAADIDGNGTVDLAWNAGPLHFAMNDGTGKFQTTGQAISGLGPFSFGDLDGDGHADIVASANTVHGLRTLVIATRPDGTYEPAVEYATPTNGAPRLVDFDGDGALDAVIPRTNGPFNNDATGIGSVYVHKGKGDGTFGPA